MDDGADLVGVLHKERSDLIAEVIGGTEETTTGVIRLRSMEADGALQYPIVAVNEADTKHFFDQSLRYGPEYARWHHPRDERAARRQERRGLWLRLVWPRRG